MTELATSISPSDWTKGIGLSILASIIGGASKLAIRKSWLMQQHERDENNAFEAGEGRNNNIRTDEAVFDQITLLSCLDRASSSDDDNILASEICGNIREDVGENRDQIQQSLASRSRRHLHMLHTEAADAMDEEDAKDYGVCAYTLVDDSGDPVACYTTSSQLEFEQNDSFRNSQTSACRKSKDSSLSLLPFQLPRLPFSLPLCCCCSFVTISNNYCAYVLRGSGMIGMTFLNPLCCVLAMNYASPSILAPFSGLTLVWIVLFSHRLIDEAPSSRQVLAAGFIVLGEIVVAMFGDHFNDAALSVKDVRHSYLQAPFLLYFACMTMWMLLLFYWMKSPSTSPFLKRFSWGAAGGSITGLQNFLKDSLTVMKSMHSSPSDSMQQIPWFLPLLVFMAISTAFGGLLLLTGCMKRYDVNYSSAMFVGSFVVSATIMSAIHYHTFQHLQTVTNYCMYPVGLFLLMIGVFLLIHVSNKDIAVQRNSLETSIRPGCYRIDSVASITVHETTTDVDDTTLSPNIPPLPALT